MDMLYIINTRLERSLKPAKTGIPDTERMLQNHWDHILCIEKAAQKFRRGKGNSQKTADAGTVSCYQYIEYTSQNSKKSQSEDAKACFGRFFPEKEDKQHCQKEKKHDPASGEYDPEDMHDQPWNSAAEKGFPEQHDDNGK